MLEILGVIGLCKMIGGVLERKGRRSGWFKFFVVIAWFGGEFAGAIIAGIAAAVMNPGKEPAMLPIYLAALVCAGLGVGVVFLIASLLPDLRPMQAAMHPAGAPFIGVPEPRDGDNPYRAPSFPDRQ
jgi:hypothetical protein